MSTERFAQQLLDETMERAMRERLGRGLSDAQSRGESARSGLLRGLANIMNDRGIQRRAQVLARTIPGITYTPHLLGTAIATAMRRSNWGDNLLRGDNSAFATGARAFMRALPAATVGAADAISDLIEDWVNQVSDDPSKPPEDRTGTFDRMFTCYYIPGRVFVARVGDDRQVVWLDETNRIPDVSNNRDEWLRWFGYWEQNGKPKMRREGSGRNARQVPMAGVRFCHPLPEDQAIAHFQNVGMNQTDLDAVRGVFGSKPTWSQRLSDETILVMSALSRSSLQFDRAERVISEDQFKDLPERQPDTDLVNRLLGAKFAPLVQDPQMRPRFGKADYKAARKLVDDWLGGETKPHNKLMSAFADGFEWATDRGWSVWTAVPIGILATVWAWLPLLILGAIFVSGVSNFIVGFTTPVVGDGVWTLPQSRSMWDWVKMLVFGAQPTTQTVMMPNLYLGITLVLIGVVKIFGVTWFFPLIQACVNFATMFWPKADQKWMTKIGWRICTFALPFLGASVFLMWLGVGVLERLVLLSLALSALGVGFGFNVIERPEMGRHLSAKKLLAFDKWMVSVPFVIVAVTGIIGAHLGEVVTGAFLLTWLLGSGFKMVLAGDPLFIISFFTGLASAGLAFFQWRGTKYFRDGDNSVVRSAPKLAGAAKLLGAISVVSMMAFFWWGSRDALPQIVDRTVSYEDITVEQSNGSWKRERTRTRESGRETVKVQEVRKQGSSTPTQTSKVDLCANNPPPEQAAILGCR